MAAERVGGKRDPETGLVEERDGRGVPGCSQGCSPPGGGSGTRFSVLGVRPGRKSRISFSRAELASDLYFFRCHFFT